MNLGTKLTLLKQRVIGGGEQEPDELKTLRKKVQRFVPDLKKVNKGLTSWLDGARALGIASEHMSSAMQGSDVELQTIADAVAKELHTDNNDNTWTPGAASLCSSAIASINKKLKMIEGLKSKVELLDNLRLQKNRQKRKVIDFEKKNDAESMAKLKRELETTRGQHDELYNELMAKFQYLVTIAEEKGGVGIVQTELTAFKHSQLMFFKNCAKTCEAYEVTNITSLDDEWLKFEMRMEQKVIERGKQESKSFQSDRNLEKDLNLNDAGNTIAEPAAFPPTPTSNTGMRKLIIILTTIFDCIFTHGTQILILNVFTDGSTRSIAELKGRPLPPAPVAAPPPRKESMPIARALYAYAPQSPDELALSYGDMITVTEQNDDGWWSGANQTTGASGLFPGNYCEIVDDYGEDEDDGAC